MLHCPFDSRFSWNASAGSALDTQHYSQQVLVLPLARGLAVRRDAGTRRVDAFPAGVNCCHQLQIEDGSTLFRQVLIPATVA